MDHARMFIAAVTLSSLQGAQPKRTFKVPLGRTHRYKYQPPHFANGRSRFLTNSMLRAEASLDDVRIHIQGAGGNSLISFDRGRLRQDSSSGSWVYNSGHLSVACSKGFYRGAANKADVLDYLSALTGGADTFARELLLRQRPFEDFLSPDETVRYAGTANIAGDRVDLLQISGKVIRGSLAIRRLDHLVVSADADTLSPGGTSIYHEHRSYTYRLLAKPQGVFRLEPKVGAKIKQLPKSAIRLGPAGLAKP